MHAYLLQLDDFLCICGGCFCCWEHLVGYALIMPFGILEQEQNSQIDYSLHLYNILIVSTWNFAFVFVFSLEWINQYIVVTLNPLHAHVKRTYYQNYALDFSSRSSFVSI